MTPPTKLLLGISGLWIIYWRVESLKHDGIIGKRVYGLLVVPCLFMSLFIVLAALNMLLDGIIAKAGH